MSAQHRQHHCPSIPKHLLKDVYSANSYVLIFGQALKWTIPIHEHNAYKFDGLYMHLQHLPNGHIDKLQLQSRYLIMGLGANQTPAHKHSVLQVWSLDFYIWDHDFLFTFLLWWDIIESRRQEILHLWEWLSLMLCSFWYHLSNSVYCIKIS